MKRGVRYGLFLCKLPIDEGTAVNLDYLVAPAVEQLLFFQRALQFLGTASDGLLHDCAREYHHFLLETIHSEGPGWKQLVPSFEVELVWRAHLLSPADYAKDCAALRDGNVLVDHSPANSYVSKTPSSPFAAPPGDMPMSWHSELVASVRRQESFMQKMLELRSAGLVSATHISAKVEEYRAFLRDAATTETALAVPCLLVDLVWHTHMLHPQRYVRESIAISGRLINHDDKEH